MYTMNRLNGMVVKHAVGEYTIYLVGYVTEYLFQGIRMNKFGKSQRLWQNPKTLENVCEEIKQGNIQVGETK